MTAMFRRAAPLLLLLVAGTLVRCRETTPDPDDHAPPSAGAPPTRDLSGSAMVTAALQRAAPDESAAWAYGTVVDVSELAAARGQLDSARAQREAATARLAASTVELQRLQNLFGDNRNVSARAVEDARAVAAADRAAAGGAEAAISAAEAALVQRWGTDIARAIIAHARWTGDVLQRRAMLIEAALPPSDRPPAMLRLQSDDGLAIHARFLARSPRLDPRLQRPTSFYLARTSVLPTGMTLTAQVPSTSAAAGALLPGSAVVWHHGQAFVFVEQPPGKYLRRPVDTSHPVADGFVEPHLVPGTRVVTRGAQQLLSELEKPATSGED